MTKIVLTVALGDGVTPAQARAFRSMIEIAVQKRLQQAIADGAVVRGEMLLAPTVLVIENPTRAQDRAGGKGKGPKGPKRGGDHNNRSA